MAKGNPRITIRFDDDDRAKICAAAAALNTSVSEFVRVAVLDKLDELAGLGYLLRQAQEGKEG